MPPPNLSQTATETGTRDLPVEVTASTFSKEEKKILKKMAVLRLL